MKAAAAFAIVNFVWQGAAIGLIAWLGFALSRSPRVRYLIGIAALALMAAAPVATFSLISQRAAVAGVTVNVQGSPEVEAAATRSGGGALRHGAQGSGEPGTATVASAWLSERLSDPRVASMVLVIWLVGVAVLSARLAFGWLGARRLTREIAAAGANVQAIANRLVVSLHIRSTVRVVESMLVKVPAVAGAFKPVVLLPAAAMSGLSMAQVEALLAHELAHVRRHDYLVNLLQSAIETLLFYHPAVWLVSRRVRQERELCCDDLALAVCGDRVLYAAALADLESLRAVSSPALSANGGANLTLAADGGELLARVRRILGHDEVSALSGRSRSLAGVAILLSIVLVLFGQAARARGAQTIDEISKKIEPPKMQEFQAEPQPPGVGGATGGAQRAVPERPIEVSPEPLATARPRGSEVQKEVATDLRAVGPFRIGDHIRIDLGYEGDPRSIRLFTTIQPNGVLNTKDFEVQATPLSVIHGVKLDGETSRTLSAEIARRFRARNLTPPAILITFDDRHGDNASRFARRETPAPASQPDTESTLAVEVAQQVGVVGNVKKPGQYNWEQGLTVEKALALAGGLTPQGAPNRITIKRKDPKTGQTVSIKVVKLDTEVQPDDVIVVPERYF